ncbi:MAG: NAD(P)-dependent oxidoreductase [Anaerolineales bacterium]|jgi:nucleoside-diphosphate-sugar epimerase|nr:dTDP-glucose 4,6-dehydratase [Anaerolineales bacterium]MCZ7548372.1 NAD(P)-dependent oxidoreductase [Anaerolineales bacterium]MDX9937893.1 NAD(P)-dependent oxidoreductase [Anaerolineales bacterium]GER78251.1 epimerase [Candidatus Denitrolinea symbiosum]
MTRHAVITGGAGYIGSLLTSELLRAGWRVTVLDSLLFGGESLVPFLSHPSFHFVKADVTDPRAVKDSLKGDWAKPEAVIHLAAIVGFPACQAVGKQAAWKYNVEATKMVFEQASALGAERFVFASSYSNYGLSPDGKPVTEESPLNPQSLYAETKIAAEEYLLGQKDAPAAPLLFRLATLYGISPRTRFDLIVNQFVLEAFSKRELIIYQRGYSRSFVHVRDTVRGILLGLDAPEAKTRGQVYNLGADNGNYTKDQIVNLVLVRMPETVVEYKNLTFGGDMRDITVSFEKIRRELGFETALTVDDGIRELVFALKSGLIRNPHDEKYRNAQFIVQ